MPTVQEIFNARKIVAKLEIEKLLFNRTKDSQKFIYGNLEMSDDALLYIIDAHKSAYDRVLADDPFTTKVLLSGLTKAEIHAKITTHYNAVQDAKYRLDDIITYSFKTLTLEVMSATTDAELDSTLLKLLAVNSLKYDATDAEVIAALT